MVGICHNDYDKRLIEVKIKKGLTGRRKNSMLIYK